MKTGLGRALLTIIPGQTIEVEATEAEIEAAWAGVDAPTLSLNISPTGRSGTKYVSVEFQELPPAEDLNRDDDNDDINYPLVLSILAGLGVIAWLLN